MGFHVCQDPGEEYLPDQNTHTCTKLGYWIVYEISSTQSSQAEEDLYLKIYEYSEAVIHLESSHTRIPAQTNSDKEMTQLLHR